MKKVFIVAVNEETANNWPICWTGQDNDGKHYNVTTNQVPASQLYQYSQGAASDAELIASLLNWYYSTDKAAEMIKDQK